ncbi:hypothetical protein Tco_1357892 [Tanacetum coccineum]
MWNSPLVLSVLPIFLAFRGKDNVPTQKDVVSILSKQIEKPKDNKIDQGVGSTSGIRACALRNFDLEVMELENSQNNALDKLPMLRLREYEM